MLNKHQQKTETTKSKLFRAAQRVFSKHGFEATSIDQIAKVAGFTRGAFYAHFKSKEDLFFAMLEHRFSEELKALRAKVAGLSDSERTAIMRDYCASRLRDNQWALLMLEFKLYIARRGPRGAKLTERFQNLRQSMKQQYMDDVMRSIPDYKVPNMSKQIILEAMVDGLSLQRAYKGLSVTEEDAERELKRVFDFII